MRVPLSWLKDFVDIDMSVNELADRLTFSGIEVSDIESIGIYNPNVICGKIVSKKLLKNRNDVFHLVIETGEAKSIQTVSNAQELLQVTEGQHIAIALPGAVLFESEGYNTKTIEENILYNQACQCTICSVKELGIGRDAFKLFLLPEAIMPGSAVRPHFQPQQEWFADEVLTIEILANIARCQSMWGVAKEVSAITRKPARLSEVDTAPPAQAADKLSVDNKVPELVKYFSLAAIRNVTIAEAPDIIKYRLALSGVKSINNLIDIGNYVMLETGQPVHVYDADKLPTQTFTVKLSNGGEQFVPLGSAEVKTAITLPKDIITINAGNDIIGIGGVIGSDGSAVSNQTKNIVLEAANFDLITIRKSQNKLKLYTEASARFSRGVSYNAAPKGVARFIELLRASSPGFTITEAARYDAVSQLGPSVIPFSPNDLNKSLGTDFSAAEIRELLAYADIHTNDIDPSNNGLAAIVPLSRQDITIEYDLYEEVARLIGYDRMPTTMPVAPIPLHPANHSLRLREAIRDAMVLSGLNEIISYTMTTPEAEAKLYYSADKRNEEERFVALMNPVSSDKTVMRRTLTPELLNVISYNRKYTDTCQFFEIGNVFRPEEPGADPKLPGEPLYLSIGITGNERPENFYDKKPRPLDFFDLKSKVEFLFDHLKIQGVSIENHEEGHRLFQPGLCGVISKNGQVFGYMGKVHPFVSGKFELADSDIYCAEIRLDKVMENAVRFFEFEELEKFPSIKVDISLLVDKDVIAHAIVSAIRDLNNERVKHIEIVDLYAGPGIAEGKKSISLRLTLYDSSKTLSQSEANSIRDEIVAFLQKKYEAVLR
ncbi:MAG TPA: phenylalanine--tRNA ligase subunit beta [Chitinophagaceae bacterium]|nr:phenylalanine--tRNA ligase subunit beta [Chitinophagaceae bacterium]